MPIYHNAVDETNRANSKNETSDDIGESRFEQQHNVAHDHRGDDLWGKVGTIENAEDRTYTACLDYWIIKKVDLNKTRTLCGHNLYIVIRTSRLAW